MFGKQNLLKRKDNLSLLASVAASAAADFTLPCLRRVSGDLIVEISVKNKVVSAVEVMRCVGDNLFYVFRSKEEFIFSADQRISEVCFSDHLTSIWIDCSTGTAKVEAIVVHILAQDLEPFRVLVHELTLEVHASSLAILCCRSLSTHLLVCFSIKSFESYDF